MELPKHYQEIVDSALSPEPDSRKAEQNRLELQARMAWASERLARSVKVATWVLVGVTIISMFVK